MPPSLMWQQNYTPLAGSIPISALVAALPIFVLLLLLGVMRKPAWIASLAGLGTAAVVAVAVYGMPAGKLAAALGYGAAFGLFPIGWVVFAAILLYRVTVEGGKFDILKDSISRLTDDPRLQALLIAFAFSAFIEGASGFGTPVAVCAAMLAGLGFSPFFAAAICLLANTAPVSFGSIGIPVSTLALTTGLPLERLSAVIGRICSPISLFIPAYLVVVMSGWKGLRATLPAVTVCGVAFAGTLFAVSNFVGAALTDILASFAAGASLVILLQFWKPSDRPVSAQAAAAAAAVPRHSARQVALAWAPYGLLVVFVLVWGQIAKYLNTVSIVFPWPGLHNTILRMPPVVASATGYPAIYTFNWLSTSGTAGLFATILAAVVVGLRPRQFVKVLGRTGKQLALAELTLAATLALAFLLNYSGATGTLGLAFSATGRVFPFFSALLGWLGVFLTGSDTSANALFGTLQVVTANHLGMNPVLMAASNSAGGSMGKLISLTSIAVAAAATSLKREDEALLFRFTLKHSILLTTVLGLMVVFFAYVAPSWVE
jgi:L-lactate transport